ncbi:hypothetical protein MYX84_02410 [Acidobacteria bacterium AH-259-O06]|nr:hypothetical protein [Acidobacteria bacterium AH-259-O06]
MILSAAPSRRLDNFLLFASFFFICLLFYRDTLYLPFTVEDYVRISKHSADLQDGWVNPLFTPSEFTPRFLPVHFYTLALEYHLFGTKIVLYRLSTLLLLAVCAFLFTKFLINSLGVRFWPAAAAGFLTVLHFANADIVYFYCTQSVFTFGEILLIILLRRVFDTSLLGSRPWLTTVILFSLAVLTLRSTVIFIPLFLYHLWFGPLRQKISARELAMSAGSLLVPVVLIFTLEALRSSLAPVLATSVIQTGKNWIVLTSHLFHPFKPFGFTDLWNSSDFSLGTLLSFIAANPHSIVMIGLSIGFTLAFSLLWWWGDYNSRFLCLGLLTNTLLFSFYAAGTSLRYLNLSTLFLAGVAAYVYSKKMPCSRSWIGVVILTALLLYNSQIYKLEKQPYLDEIHYVNQVKQAWSRGEGISDEQRPELLRSVDSHELSEALRRFWHIQ